MTIAPSPGQVTFPRGPWIPNIDQLTHTGAGLLAVVGAALDAYDLGADFTRRVFTHGDAVVQVSDDPQSQLFVSWTSLELGEAGQKVFQFQKGDIGSHAHMTGQFKVQLWIPWPTPSGGMAPSMQDDNDLMAAAASLNRVHWVAFSALRSLSLAGTRIVPPVTPIVQDGIIVGPATPLDPKGGMAGVSIDVQVSYD